MLKVVNVSKRIVIIGAITLRPLQSAIFTDVTDDVRKRINALESIGIVKVYPVTEDQALKTKKSKK